MTTRWRAYIEKGIRDAGGPVPFALSQWVFLNPIVTMISQSVPRGGRILDVGFGAGVFTALLSHSGYEVVGIDSESYVYGGVPTWLAANLDRFLPRAPYKVLKNLFSYGMGTVVLGER